MSSLSQTTSIKSFEHVNVVPIIRTAKALPAALAITATLLYAMQAMIAIDAEPIAEEPTKPLVDIYLKEMVLETQHLEKPEPIEPPSVEPDFPKFVAPISDGGEVLPIPGVGEVNLTADDIQIGMDTGGAIPHIQVAPKYPSRALTRGIEGFVDVQFDVTEFGATENIRVLRAEPEGVFERSALQAVKRWKYKPMMQDGESVGSPNHRDRIRFKLQK